MCPKQNSWSSHFSSPFQCSPSSVGPTQSPFPTRNTGRILGISQGPSFPSSPPSPSTMPECPTSHLHTPVSFGHYLLLKSFSFPLFSCLHAVPATATLHLHPLYKLLSLVPVLAIASKHQPNCIKSQSKTLPGVHCSQVELREVLGMAHQPCLVQHVSQSLLHPRH